jgi:hypothetical protein
MVANSEQFSLTATSFTEGTSLEAKGKGDSSSAALRVSFPGNRLYENVDQKARSLPFNLCIFVSFVFDLSFGLYF